MKDRKITLWDALLSTNYNISTETHITTKEFKYIINSLDLNLKLKEKLMLIRMADPDGKGKCDIQLFISKIENDTIISKRGI